MPRQRPRESSRTFCARQCSDSRPWRSKRRGPPCIAACATQAPRGAGSMAVSAVDIALWDLKARLMGIPLVELFGPVRDAVEIYGSGGFTSYSEKQLCNQLAQWASEGIPRVENEGRPGRGGRHGPRAGGSESHRTVDWPFRRRQWRLFAQAGVGDGAGIRRLWRELVRGALLERRSERTADAARPRARGYGHCGRRIWRPARILSAHFAGRRRRLPAGRC